MAHFQGRSGDAKDKPKFAHRLGMFLKVIAMVGVLACLAWQFTRLDPAAWERVRQGSLHWHYLGIALPVFLLGVVLTFVRWYLLAQALRVDLPLRSAISLGFLGYLLQFVSLGSIGGDVFKAFLVARNQPGRRAHAVASVIMDRILGALSMLLIAMLLCLRPDAWQWLPRQFWPVMLACLAMLLVGLLGLAISLYSNWTITQLLLGIPGSRRLWPLTERLDRVLRAYRERPAAIWSGILLGLASHFLEALAVYWASLAVTVQPPGFLRQLTIWPIAGFAGAVPLTPAGLGTFDAVFTYLYNQAHQLPGSTRDGLLVAAAFRGICLITAMLGLLVYLAHRNDLRLALEESANQDVEDLLSQA